MYDQLVLIGLSGTGKSTLAREAAIRLGWDMVDLDDDIVRTTGRLIPDIFAEEGEPAFRVYERTELTRALARERVVVATGGGAPVADDAWTDALLGNPRTLTVWLDADENVMHRRLIEATHKYGDAVARPLLGGGDALEKMRAMRAARVHAYGRADVTVPVGRGSVETLADDLAELVRLGNGEASSITLTLPAVTSHVVVGRGVRHRLAETIATAWPRAQRTWIAADEHVVRWREDMFAALLDAGYDVRTFVVPAGEDQKSVAGVSKLWDWLLDGGVQRQDVLIALGGGKIGDLAGFAAATVLRGIGLVQMPTTLLSMVDSSIGGKTAINHASGKNLIGAFYQPQHVLIDPDVLVTVPPRELASGWAEIIKHGEIQQSTPGGDHGSLREVLAMNATALHRLDEPVLSWVIRQNLTIKAAVVEADEKEAGLRAILNYGHTIGHAIEASGYRYLHGEAIAIGLVAASRIAVELGRIDRAAAERLEATISSFGLPTRGEGDLESIIARTSSDKKKSAGRQQWVLANDDGGVGITTNVDPDVVSRVVQGVLQGA